jgi:hypothetical protein
MLSWRLMRGNIKTSGKTSDAFQLRCGRRPWPFFDPTGRRGVAAGGAARPHGGPTRNPWKEETRRPRFFVIFAPAGRREFEERRKVACARRLFPDSAWVPRPKQHHLTPAPSPSVGRGENGMTASTLAWVHSTHPTCSAPPEPLRPAKVSSPSHRQTSPRRRGKRAAQVCRPHRR